MAKRYGWIAEDVHCGHLVGNFPHEQIQGDDVTNYIHRADKERFGIYEIHFVNPELEISGFFEQLVC